MPRKYRHMQEYEKEILELKAIGFTRKETGDKLGFTIEEIRDCIKRVTPMRASR